MMRVEPGRLPGMLVFTPSPIADERGYFSRIFDAEIARGAGLRPEAFVQDSQSRSRRGVIRGLHVRTGPGEAKLVRCSYGAVFDVVVDVRPGSATFGTWVSLRLDDAEHRSVYIPAGYAHGFQALTDPADICYRIDQPHDPAYDLTIRWDDDELGVAWPLPVTKVSERDRAARPLREVLDRLG
jgi:dTDP-4-dehydrorhamnose 3,5-epimerase